MRCVNISKEISDEWVKIQAKNMGGCEEESGECARISANMKMLCGCEYQPRGQVVSGCEYRPT